jgi:hypothetical protein
VASIDLVLTVIFGTISVLGLAGAVFCFIRALSVANKKDGDIKMFLWAVGTMACLIVAGMSAAYILLPILFTYAR